MLYGAMNFPIRPVLEEIHAIGSLGLDYLELAMDNPEAHYIVLRQQRDAIQQALDHYGMSLICHLRHNTIMFSCFFHGAALPNVMDKWFFYQHMFS